jgi:hypothetical protein
MLTCRPVRCWPLLALWLAGCDPPPIVRDYEVSLIVSGDPGQPLADAEVSQGAEPIGRSGPDGKVHLLLRGREGRAVALRVRCPEGYRSPSEPISIVLRRLGESERHPQWRARCAPLLRTLVIAVRADGGANLPVSILGREVARTDALGAAHVLVRSAPEETVELTLDTSASPGLRPRSPSARFEVPSHDDVALFSQAFEAPRAAATPRRAPRIVKIGAR